MFGDQIKELRQAAGLSQVQLAAKLNVSKQSVSNWENNNIMPSIDMLRRICEVLSCSADYLLELHDDQKIYIESTGLTLEQKAHIQRYEELRDRQAPVQDSQEELSSISTRMGKRMYMKILRSRSMHVSKTSIRR